MVKCIYASQTPTYLPKDIGTSTTTVLEILNGKRKITVETALRLAKYFGNSE
jgi:plasmid maintenance system antidote protein VapI